MGCKIRKNKSFVPLMTAERLAENAINEMAETRQDFINKVSGKSLELYRHLLYVCVLESYFPEMIEHWKGEIITFARPVVRLELKRDAKKTNRAKVIEEHMMKPHMGIKFEDYCIEEYEDAMNSEIRKAQKQLDNPQYKNDYPLLRKMIKTIKSIIPMVGEFVEPNRQRLINFYEDYKDAALNRDDDDLIAAVDRFINTKPIFQED